MAMTGGTSKLVKTGYAEYGNTSLPIKLYVYYKTSQDAETNKSTITVGMYVTTPSSSYSIGSWDDNNGSYVGTTSLTFNGAVPSGTKGTYWLVENKTFTVTHNNDGTGKTTIYWKWGVNSPWGQMVNPSGSFEITLPTIARLSVPTVSSSSVKMGDKVTIYTNRKADTFKHILYYTFGNQKTVKIADSVTTSYTWTVPDLAAECNNATSGTCTIRCDTYADGKTYIGTKNVTLTLNVPGATTPTVSATTVKMGGSVTLGVSGRKSTNFKHIFQYSFGSKVDVTIKDGVTSSYLWTVPDLAAECNNATSGTCTIKCHTYNGTKYVGTVSKTITLQVPDASVPTLSASTITMGNSLTIYTNRKSSNFTHVISYDFHGKKGTPSGAATTSCSLLVDVAGFAGYIPSATSGTGTITCVTKNGTATVGTKTVTFTATVPDNATTKPSFTSSGFTLTPSGSIPSAFGGLYIQGKTGVSASFSASSAYSTIASYKMTAEGNNYSGNPATSRAFSTSGTKTITGTVTDARGFSTVLSKNITVIPYNTPKLIPYGSNKSIVCERCTSDGTPYDGGQFLKIKVGRSYSKVMSGTTQKNFCAVGYRYKTSAATSYSSDVILIKSSDTFDEVDTEPIAGIVESLTTSYDVQIFVTDTMGESDEYTVRVPTAGTDFHLREGGKGAAFGKYAERENGVEFKWDVYGRAYGLGKLIEIPEGSDLNDEKYREFGCYAVTKDAIAETVKNLPALPAPKAGVLRVYSSTGDGRSSDEFKSLYITQEFTPYTGYGVFQRLLEKDGDNGWNFDSDVESRKERSRWKAVGGVDSVVESGSIAKSGVTWHYRRWFDGTAECWARRNVAVNITNEWGTAIYYGVAPALDFPFTFAEVPMCQVSSEYGESAYSCFIACNGVTTKTQAPSVMMCRGTKADGFNYTLLYYVKGRWK